LIINIDADRLQASLVSEPEVATADAETGTIVELAPIKDTFDWLASERAWAEFNAIFAPCASPGPGWEKLGRRFSAETVQPVGKAPAGPSLIFLLRNHIFIPFMDSAGFEAPPGPASPTPPTLNSTGIVPACSNAKAAFTLSPFVNGRFRFVNMR
jgi:hypothetical protein